MSEDTPSEMAKLYHLGLLERDRGTWILRDHEGNEVEVMVQRVNDCLEIICTPDAARLFDAENHESLGSIPVEELSDQDRITEDSIITLDEAMKIGEGEKIEFKRQCPPKAGKIGKEVVSLANHKGGILVIGIDDDDWSVYGLDDIEETEERVINACKDCVEPSIDFT